MTVARTWGVVLTGIQGDLVEVEADLSQQTPGFTIIGLADKAIGEATQRVHNACANSGLPLPRRKLTVNLSPASLPKHGSALDLAIAIAALATQAPMDAASLLTTAHIGELGLDGRLRPGAGVPPPSSPRCGRACGRSSCRGRTGKRRDSSRESRCSERCHCARIPSTRSRCP